MLPDAVMASRPLQPKQETKRFNLAHTRIVGVVRNHTHDRQEGTHAMKVGRIVVREEVNLSVIVELRDPIHWHGPNRR